MVANPDGNRLNKNLVANKVLLFQIMHGPISANCIVATPREFPFVYKHQWSESNWYSQSTKIN